MFLCKALNNKCFNTNENKSITISYSIFLPAFEELSALNFKGKRTRSVLSNELSTDEIAKVLGEIIGKHHLQWTKFIDEDTLNGLLQAGLTLNVAGKLVEMGPGVESGVGLSDYLQHKPILGSHKFDELAKEFAVAYANS